MDISLKSVKERIQQNISAIDCELSSDDNFEREMAKQKKLTERKKRQKTFLKKFFINFAIKVCVVMVIISGILVYSSNVYAAGITENSISDALDSWADLIDSEQLAVKRGQAGAIEDHVTEAEKLALKPPSTLAKGLADIIWSLGTSLNSVFVSFKPEVTIDFVLTGKSSSWDGANIFQFGLEEGNPYGAAGAYIYVAMRYIVLALIFVVTCYKLMKLAIGGGAKYRMEVKQVFIDIILVMFFIYFFPYFVQLIYTLRDAAQKALLNALEGATMASSSVTLKGSESLSAVFLAYRDKSAGDIAMALCYVGVQGASIVFIFEYIGIALTLMILFGIAPLVFLLSMVDKSVFNKWVMGLIANILVPLFDYAIFVALFAIIAVGQSGGADDTLMAIIALIGLFNVVPARKFALGFIGSSVGFATGTGLGTLGAIAGSAGGLKNAVDRLTGKNGGESVGDRADRIADDRSNARIAEEMGNSTTRGGDTTTNRGIEMRNLEELGSTGGNPNGGGNTTVGITEIADGTSARSGGDGGATEIENIDQTSSSMSVGGDSESVTVDGAQIDGSDMEGVLAGGALGYGVGEIVGGGFSDVDLEPTLSEAEEYYDAGRLTNLEAMDSDRAQIESLESGIASNELKLSGYTDDVGEVGDNYSALSDSYATLNKAELDLDAARESQKTAADNWAFARDSQNEQKQTEASTTLDAANSRLSKAEDKVAELRTSIDKQEQALGMKSGGNYTTIRDLESRQNAGDRRTAISNNQKQLASEGARVTREAGQLRHEISTQKAQLNAVRSDYKHRQEVEKDYAHADKSMGGKGTSYANAGQVKQTENMNSILRQNATMKNFDTGDYKYALSQSEKADYYRERATATQISGIAKDATYMASGIALTAVKASATVAMATGGVDTVAAINGVGDNIVMPIREGVGYGMSDRLDRRIDGATNVRHQNVSAGNKPKISSSQKNSKTPTKRVFTDGPLQPNLDPTMQALHEQARAGREAQEAWRKKNGK